MKASIEFLSKFVDLKGIKHEDIASKLTFAGVKVEEIEEFAVGSNLVIGEVKECKKMEDSDHLHLTKVYCGPKHQTLDIVCGAPNVKEGIKVIVALDGATLKDGFKIKKGKIRGHTSEGMLCSLMELGVDSKYLHPEEINGIAVLDKNAKVGNEKVLEYLGLKHTVLDLELLANRGDLYALINIAKELATLFNRKLNLSYFESKDFKRMTDSFEVGSLTKECPQFAVSIIKGIKVKPSSNELRFLLASMGIRSINNIVDVGNFVMLLTGQPLHMYDLDKLPKHELIVKDDFKGKFLALDENTYELKKGDLVVTSDNKPMCLGGVMGSLECAVDEKTTNIVIEAANFYYANIRRSAIRTGLLSESSQRFIKGINPHQAHFVLDLATSLVLKHCEGNFVGEIHEYDVLNHKLTEIKFSISRVNALLGTSFKDAQIISCLNNERIKTRKSGKDYIALVPPERIDMKDECDIAEEVIRLMGFADLKATLPSGPSKMGYYHKESLDKLKAREYFRSIGLDEVLTYSLLSKEESAKLNYLNKSEPAMVINPLSDEHKYVRTNLLTSLLKVASYNSSRGQINLNIFEVSDLYSLDSKECHVGVILQGGIVKRNALMMEPYDFYHLKGIAIGYLNHLGIKSSRIKLERVEENDSSFYPFLSAYLLVDKKVCGVLGQIQDTVKKEFDINTRISLLGMELNLTYLNSLKGETMKAPTISKYPVVRRDYAFVVPKNVTYGEIKDEIERINRILIQRVEVFDLYYDEKSFESAYSLAISIYYNSKEKTLVDEDVKEIEEKIKDTLKKKYNVILRT